MVTFLPESENSWQADRKSIEPNRLFSWVSVRVILPETYLAGYPISRRKAISRLDWS